MKRITRSKNVRGAAAGLYIYRYIIGPRSALKFICGPKLQTFNVVEYAGRELNTDGMQDLSRVKRYWVLWQRGITLVYFVYQASMHALQRFWLYLCLAHSMVLYVSVSQMTSSEPIIQQFVWNLETNLIECSINDKAYYKPAHIFIKLHHTRSYIDVQSYVHF